MMIPDKVYGQIKDWSVIETPLGDMLACAAEEGICLLEFMEKDVLNRDIDKLENRPGPRIVSPHISALKRELEAYFEGSLKSFSVPLFTPGTRFQEAAWQALKAIPYGQTRSYRQQAEAIGRPKAYRAVAQANHRNRITVVIPCHRVIGADGSLTGFGAGLWRKERLLDHERRHSVRN
jgi:AraC family transcriptional regulator of adaptative response/methylated-DNA-[protein]-cysteine methyltransferase